MIPYEDLSISNSFLHPAYINSFAEVLAKGNFILGKKVEEFELRFSEFCEAGYCIGTGNGLDALILVLKALNLSPTDEVIVPSNTYIATILSILHNNLKPVMAEPDINTCNLTAASIEPLITRNTKVIMLVHLYGKCCPMDEILALAKKNNIIIIEDCAQSHGAKYKGQICGTFGMASSFSFYPTKNLGALGDGGAVITNDATLALTVKKLRNYGSGKKYYNELIGYNSRLDELQAAFLLVKLEQLDTITNHKRKIASFYLEHLKQDFIKPVVHPDFFDVYHIFNIRHPKRDGLRKYLLDNDIGTEIHYPIPPQQQKALAGLFDSQSFPISSQIHHTTLSIPCSLCHSEDDIARVVEIMNKF